MGIASAGIVICAGVVLAVAQQAKRPLHQDIPSPNAATEGPGAATSAPGPTENPEMLSAGDKLLPKPSTATPPSANEPVFGSDGFAADRQTEAQLDRQTASDGTLHYASVFNPDVLPFKRMSALNAIDDSDVLGVTRGKRTMLAVGGAATATRDRFWGSLVLSLAPDQPIALPSVAPDMRILSYEAEPATQLVFSKDAADNFFVQATGIKQPVTVRLVMNVDADAGYFAPALPAGRWTPSAVRAQAPNGAIAAMPPAVKTMAQQSIAELGISEHTELGRAFNALVAYHRAFAAGDPPRNSGNTYRDLFSAQVGVCRHRSFVFMITANALGIPTRYVTNEAHAFVEVWFPQRGWQRIDLGGAALNLEVHNGDQKTIHRPRSEDPFAKPDAYRDNYTQLRGDIGGLSDEQLAARWDPHAPSSGNDLFGQTASNDPNAPIVDDPNTAAHPPAPATAGGPANVPTITLDNTPPDPNLITPVIELAVNDTQKGRLQSLGVSGAVSNLANKEPLAGRTVQIFIVATGESLERAQWLGSAVTDASGLFVGNVTIPATLHLGSYEVYAVTQQDRRHNAGTSE